MVLGNFEGGAQPLPGGLAGARARIEALNAAGGLNGHPVDLTVCDDQSDTNLAAGCARQAVSDGVVAVLGTTNIYGGAIFPILEEARIPYVGNPIAVPEDLANPMAFPYGSGGFGEWAGAAVSTKDAGCTKVGLIRVDVAATETIQKYVLAGLDAAGMEFTETTLVAQGTPDLAPAVSAALASGADCLAMNVFPADAIKAFNAAQQLAPDVKIFSTSSTYPQTTIDAIGESANGNIFVSSTFYPVTSDQPGVQEYVAQMDEYSADADLDVLSLRGWLSAQFFAAVAGEVDGPVTQESFLSTLLESNAVDLLGIVEDLDVTTPGPVASQPRAFNLKQLPLVVEDGVFVPLVGGFVDVGAVFATVAASS